MDFLHLIIALSGIVGRVTNRLWYSELRDITGQSSHRLENLQKIIITRDGCKL